MSRGEAVGQRVVVRRVVTGTAGRTPGRTLFSDVVGVLLRAEPAGLAVRTRTGDVVEVPREEVAIVKAVPASAAEILALEETAARGWRAPDVGRLGGWLLRAAGGWTGRANSVLPLGDPGRPLDDALGEVAAWYAERDLAPRFQVPLPLRASLDAALVARGWTPYNATRVLTADLGLARAAVPAAGDLPPVEIAGRPSAGWLSAYHYRGGTLPAFAVEIMVDADRPAFASVTDGEETVAIARGVLDDGWLGVTAVEVGAAHRRRGLGTHVMRGLFDWAARAGATNVYLQVAEENAAALALYGRLGFADHHGYRYLLAPT